MTVRVIYNDFPKLARRTAPAADNVVRGVAYQISRDANAAAPRHGWHHAAADLRKSYRAQPVREAPDGVPTWEAFSPNWYAWLVEFGAHQEPARPHLTPAAERGRQKLVADMARQFESGLG